MCEWKLKDNVGNQDYDFRIFLKVWFLEILKPTPKILYLHYQYWKEIVNVSARYEFIRMALNLIKKL